jgi:hypothetical protein
VTSILVMIVDALVRLALALRLRGTACTIATAVLPALAVMAVIAAGTILASCLGLVVRRVTFLLLAAIVVVACRHDDLCFSRLLSSPD